MQPGVLLLCGKGLTKSGAHQPIAHERVDKAGDCVYPTPVVCGSSANRFVKASTDVNVFVALDSNGDMWGWTSGTKSAPFGLNPEKMLAKVTDCAAGSSFAAAIVEGAVHIVGSPSGSLKSGPLPFDATPPPQAAAVDACNNTVLVLDSVGRLWAAGGCLEFLTTGLGEGKRPSSLTQITSIPDPVITFAVGSRHAAAVTTNGEVWVWGDGLSGTLGLGRRCVALTPQKVETFGGELKAVHVACTRGQAAVTRSGTAKSMATGQEGPRCQVVCDDGSLWVAGTTHKGLGADHLHKTFMPPHDHLTFYRIGGPAADSKKAESVPTGAAEYIKEDPAVAAKRMGMTTLKDYGAEGCTGYLKDVKIVASACAHIHSCALTADGRLFSWGCGSNGRTGLAAFMKGPGGSKRTMKCYVSTPTEVEELEGVTVQAVSVGRYWTLSIATGLQSRPSTSKRKPSAK